MISNKIMSNSVANAVGGKTARACDSCIKRRAKWYCAADDAFLCQSCDSSVHSANSLALRHERVRLKIASLKTLDVTTNKLNSLPSWHKGFTRKARTPRHNKSLSHSKLEDVLRNPIPLVPEVGCDEASHEENCEEEQLLYRVPIFEPFVAELCNNNPSTPLSANEGGCTSTPSRTPGDEPKISLTASNGVLQDGDSLHGFLPSDMDLAEFAANVESLLGKGLENEAFGMEELGLVDCKEEEGYHQREYSQGNNVKIEEEEEEEEEECLKELKRENNMDEIEVGREAPFELSFDYDSPASCGEGDEEVEYNRGGKEVKEDDEEKMKRKRIALSLDYEAVITAWSSHGCSPWTNGERPDFDPDECWPHCMGCRGENGYGEGRRVEDGGREARVSRYREKRRRRLFSKKIRYEVRKLNAEKRPRMKGRFVKRASAPPPLLT